jgi:hypothetical protein
MRSVRCLSFICGCWSTFEVGWGNTYFLNLGFVFSDDKFSYQTCVLIAADGDLRVRYMASELEAMTSCYEVFKR